MKRLKFAAVISLLSACQVVANYQHFDAADAQSDSRCGNLPTSKTDDHNITRMARVDITDGACVWMDTTEVTVGDYDDWLGDNGPDAVKWDQRWCGWKDQREDPRTSMSEGARTCRDAIDSHDALPFDPSKPIRCVDWCEADAYCHWAGKRLCYDFGLSGVQVPRDKPREWREACSNRQSTAYPWGTTPKSGYCNAAQSGESCQIAGSYCLAYPVQAWVECKTRSNIYDMLGNVAEWVYSCVPQDPELADLPTGCLTLGGGYDKPLQACQGEDTVPNDTRAPDLGFRCCSDLTPDEEGQLTQ